MYGEGYWLLPRRPDWSPWLCRSTTTEASLIRGLLMEDSCQSSSIHVYVFLHREVGVNSGRSDQLALAESGLLTLDPCWVVLSINPLGLSWSWCSFLSSGSAKHTATFTLQFPLSVSLALSSIPARSSCWPLESSTALNLLADHQHTEHHLLCISVFITLNHSDPHLLSVLLIDSVKLFCY